MFNRKKPEKITVKTPDHLEKVELRSSPPVSNVNDSNDNLKVQCCQLSVW